MHEFFCWLQNLPKWQQAVTAVFFFLGIPLVALVALYKWVTSRIQSARYDALYETKSSAGSSGTLQVPDTLAISQSKPIWIPEKLWGWLAKKATRWEHKKKL
jgi:hypothetical protein